MKRHIIKNTVNSAKGALFITSVFICDIVLKPNTKRKYNYNLHKFRKRYTASLTITINLTLEVGVKLRKILKHFG